MNDPSTPSPPEPTDIVSAQAYLDQQRTAARDLSQQVSAVWADLPAEARAQLWASWDEPTRTLLGLACQDSDAAEHADAEASALLDEDGWAL